MKRGLTNMCYGFFSTLANPTRLTILEKLSKSDMNVTQLAKSMALEQSMISHNLKPLERCYLVHSERVGKTKVYSLNRDTVESIFKIVESHAMNHCAFKGNCPNSRGPV